LARAAAGRQLVIGAFQKAKYKIQNEGKIQNRGGLMDDLVLKIPWSGARAAEREPLLTREWLVTNGLGGYASGTIGGVSTRRYHGLLVAALPAPAGRRMMLNHLSELVRLLDGTPLLFGGEEHVGGALHLHGADHLTEFRLEAGLPVWHYQVGDIAFEKRVLLSHRQNTAYVNYRLVSGSGPVRVKIRPSVHFRPHDAPVSEKLGTPYTLTTVEDRYELAAQGEETPLRMRLCGQRSAFTVDCKRLQDLLYRVEESRGYEHAGDLWSPGYFRVDLTRDRDATLVASTEIWDKILALDPTEAFRAEHERRRRLLHAAAPAAQASPGGDLVLAADQFIIYPAGRVADEARALAEGDEVRTVIAGYHWFTDWGRDTMICLEGLTLATGRQVEAEYILRTFSHYIRDGLIPNMFPEGKQEGLYHTADATLWFFHAIARYVDVTGDRETLRYLLPRLQDIVHHHLQGTRFGIHVDPADGLLHQGQDGYQLTWMDAKVGDWVVTPRRGKAVEINALWYNALRLLEGWLREEHQDDAARQVAGHADRARQAFNERFWYARGGYLYDVVDAEGGGNDSACRPNQVFAISLDHPVLDPSRWPAVLEVVRQKLLTPVGLRSLSPDHPEYKRKYFGDLRSRDAAYHQGTVWPWLIGPYVDAWLHIHPGDRAGARQFLDGLIAELSEACIGTISEVCDAEEPYTPRGCIAQAWSVAEVLRCWVKTAGSRDEGRGARGEGKD
jgi:predicted glycogen debranching enzyme